MLTPKYNQKVNKQLIEINTNRHTAGVTNFHKNVHINFMGVLNFIPISNKLSKKFSVPYTHAVENTSRKHKNNKLDVHLLSKTVKSKIPALVHIGSPHKKNMRHKIITMTERCLVQAGFSSKMNAGIHNSKISEIQMDCILVTYYLSSRMII